MSIVSNILGTNAPASAAYPQTTLPVLTGQPTSNIPSGPVPALTPDPYGADAFQPSATYQPAAYRVPTASPSLIPAAVTGWRAQETMMPAISTRQVASIKEVAVEGAKVSTRAAEGAATTARAGRAASRAKSVAQAEGAATGTAAATEAGAAEAVTGTKQVRTMKTKVDATPKLTTAGLWGAVKTSALVSGAISLALNGYAVIKGQQTFAQGGSNVVGDVAAGAVGGVGGAVASAFGAPLIAGALGIAGGLPLTALTFGLGLGGYWLADKLFRNTGFFKSLKADVHSLLSGNPSAVQAPLAPQYPAANAYQTLPLQP
ncbi:MAG: hypothetical protein ACK46X_04300 [Candidatus Sericytochromatia bacterium]